MCSICHIRHVTYYIILFTFNFTYEISFYHTCNIIVYMIRARKKVARTMRLHEHDGTRRRLIFHNQFRMVFDSDVPCVSAPVCVFESCRGVF